MVKRISGVTRLDKVDRILAENAAEETLLKTPRYLQDDADLNPDIVKPCWERLPTGTAIRVWWASAEEYYECTIIDWRIGYDENKNAVYTHRCQYPGGIMEHDLSKADFDVVEGDEDLDGFGESAQMMEESSASGAASEEMSGTRSRLQSWLIKQEEAETRGRVSTSDNAADAHHDANLTEAKDPVQEKPHPSRSKGAMRRVKNKASNMLMSPLKKSAGEARCARTSTHPYP